MASKAQVDNLVDMLDGYVEKGGHHLNVNVYNRETLIDAQKHPERYRDLLVRVAGYSDYFNDMTPQLQNEIIARTENEAF